MRALMIGKYPPIEGGVSAHTYWLARGLAEKGNIVPVVTNARRVEESYRVTLDTSDREYIVKGVSLYSLKNAPPKHIPYSEGFVTRLVNESLRAIEEVGADVIYAHYLEPYGVAALMVKQLTGIPLVVRHAGSDIHLLLRNPEYAFTLARVLQGADAVVATNSMRTIASTLGIEEKLFTLAPRARHSEFSSEGERVFFRHKDKNPLPRLIYIGKASKRKGLFEMLEVCDSGADFVLTYVTQGPIRKEIEERINRSRRLQERVELLDFVPPWKIPALIRGSEALLQLENDFPVAIHAPSQPYEGIACGVPLLLSREMFNKLDTALQREEYFTVVQNPTNLEELQGAVRRQLASLENKKADTKALELREIYKKDHDWERYLASHEEFFNRAKSLSRSVSLRRFLKILR